MNIFNSHVYVSVDNETIKILKEIEFVNSYILENIEKISSSVSHTHG